MTTEIEAADQAVAGERDAEVVPTAADRTAIMPSFFTKLVLKLCVLLRFYGAAVLSCCCPVLALCQVYHRR